MRINPPTEMEPTGTVRFPVSPVRNERWKIPLETHTLYQLESGVLHPILL